MQIDILNSRVNPWDAAKTIKVVRGNGFYPDDDLEPGVKFFVLMLEQIGATTLYSCEGHPDDFYVAFSSSYETALRVKQCGFFTTEIWQLYTWTIRIGHHEGNASQNAKERLLRWAALNWEAQLGRLTLLDEPASQTNRITAFASFQLGTQSASASGRFHLPNSRSQARRP